MAKALEAYQTTVKEPSDIDNLTATSLPGDKWALDVNILDGNINVTVGDADPVVSSFYNVPIVTSDTEQSLALPSVSRGYMIKTRGKGKLKLSHTSGQSGTTYVDIPGGAVFRDDNKYMDLTLYFQSPTAGEVVEIIAWS